MENIGEGSATYGDPRGQTDCNLRKHHQLAKNAAKAHKTQQKCFWREDNPTDQLHKPKHANKCAETGRHFKEVEER